MVHDDSIRAQLQAAVTAEDADAFDAALSRAYSFDAIDSDLSDILISALGMPWHQRHEDVVHALQHLKDRDAVEALYAAALSTHDYLAYDEFFGLARKCTWALADIGTRQARARLEDLARSAGSCIGLYAQKRLDNWDAERRRKRGD